MLAEKRGLIAALHGEKAVFQVFLCAKGQKWPTHPQVKPFYTQAWTQPHAIILWAPAPPSLLAQTITTSAPLDHHFRFIFVLFCRSVYLRPGSSPEWFSCVPLVSVIALGYANFASLSNFQNHICIAYSCIEPR